MINPDGVIIGNQRSDLIGRDVNRCYHEEQEKLSPVPLAIKELVKVLTIKDKERI